MDSNTKRMQCLVCGSQHLERLSSVFSRYQKKGIMSVGICPQCGHVQLTPLPMPEDVEYFNNRFLGKKYSTVTTGNGNHTLKLSLLKERIDGLVKPGMRVLDIGAGEGWAMNYFQGKACDYFAIEAIDDLRLALSKRGATVIAESIYDDLREYVGRFDVIIFRHILEHLTEPSRALDQIQDLLKPDGFLYLALPNGEKPEVSKGMTTSFFRPVHVSYFHQGNVVRLAHQSGLRTEKIVADREIYAIIRIGGVDLEERNFYMNMKSILKVAKYRAIFQDSKNIIKIFLRRVLSITQ